MQAGDVKKSLGRGLKRVDGRLHLSANHVQCVAVAVAFLLDLFEQRLDAKQPYGDL